MDKLLRASEDGKIEFYLLEENKLNTLYIINKRPLTDMNKLYKDANLIAWRIKQEMPIHAVEYMGFKPTTLENHGIRPKKAKLHGFRS